MIKADHVGFLLEGTDLKLVSLTAFEWTEEHGPGSYSTVCRQNWNRSTRYLPHVSIKIWFTDRFDTDTNPSSYALLMRRGRSEPGV